MHPSDHNVLVQERISELMRISSDIHRGPEGASIASRIAGALSGPVPRPWSRIEALASGVAAAIGIGRPAPRT
jgi:hypothetical protein